MKITEVAYILILLMFVFHVFSNLEFTGLASLSYEKGDCNQDGVLNWNDVGCYEQVLRYGYQYDYLDLNDDKKVNYDDLLLLQDRLTR